MDFPEGTIYIEIRGIFDGSSVAQLPDGRMVNLWEPTSSRYIPTQKWIDDQNNRPLIRCANGEIDAILGALG